MEKDRTIEVGDLVYVTILKNGYWKGQRKGRVLKINEATNRASVSTNAGNWSYSLNNLSICKKGEAS